MFTDTAAAPARPAALRLTAALLLMLTSAASAAAATPTYHVCSSRRSGLDFSNERLMLTARKKLLNPELFGPKGSAGKATLNFSKPLATISASSLRLAQCNIWFSGHDRGWSAPEKAALKRWAAAADHFVIAACDDALYGDACDAVGRPVRSYVWGHPAPSFPAEADPWTPFVNPLQCGAAAGTLVRPSISHGRFGYFPVQTGDYVLMRHGHVKSGQPIMIADANLTHSRFLLMGHSYLFTGDTTTREAQFPNLNDFVLVNAFKFAIDSISGRADRALCPASYTPPSHTVCTRKGSYGDFNSDMFRRARAKLSNKHVFGGLGAGGWYTFKFLPSFAAANFSVMNASGCQIWVSGADEGMSATEVAELNTWVKASSSHFLIAGCDSPGADGACRAVGQKVTAFTAAGCGKVHARALPSTKKQPNPLICGAQTQAVVNAAGGKSAHFQAPEIGQTIIMKYDHIGALDYNLGLMGQTGKGSWAVTGDVDMWSDATLSSGQSRAQVTAPQRLPHREDSSSASYCAAW